jgi:hypothetical protein
MVAGKTIFLPVIFQVQMINLADIFWKQSQISASTVISPDSR